MKLHIGKAILSRLTLLGMSKSEFARRINKSPQNVQDIFTRKSIDTELLRVISEVLNYNFFTLFVKKEPSLEGTNMAEMKEEVKKIAETLQHISGLLAKKKKPTKRKRK